MKKGRFHVPRTQPDSGASSKHGAIILCNTEASTRTSDAKSVRMGNFALKNIFQRFNLRSSTIGLRLRAIDWSRLRAIGQIQIDRRDIVGPKTRSALKL